MSDTQYLFHVDSRDVADEGDELAIQRRFIRAMRMLAPGVKVVATPNAARRSVWEARRAKQEGIHAGWPDLNIYWSNGIDANAIPGMAMIEFKAAKGRLSEDQIVTLNWLYRHGFPCGVFRNVDTAIAFLRKAGAPFLPNHGEREDA